MDQFDDHFPLTLAPGLVSISMISLGKNDTLPKSTPSKTHVGISKRQTSVPVPASAVTTTNATTDCGTQMTSLKIGDSGNITSPNYPDLYPPSIKCAWWLQVRLARSKDILVYTEIDVCT